MSIIRFQNSAIYVAASTHGSQRKRVRAFTHAVLEMGWRLSHDWLSFHEQMEAKGAPPTEEQVAQAVYSDVLGVRTCNTFVFLVPPEEIVTNADIEFGIALGARIPNILLVGKLEDLTRRFFTGMTAVNQNIAGALSDEHGLKMLRDMRDQTLTFERGLGL